MSAALGAPGTPKSSTSLIGSPQCSWNDGKGAAGNGDTINIGLISAQLCKTDRILQTNKAVTASPGNSLYTDLGEGGLSDGVAIDVATRTGCFHVDGTDDAGKDLPMATIVAAARAVAAHLP